MRPLHPLSYALILFGIYALVMAARGVVTAANLTIGAL